MAGNRSPACCMLMDMAFNARTTPPRDASEDVQMRSAACGAWLCRRASVCVCVFIAQISRWQCLCTDEKAQAAVELEWRHGSGLPPSQRWCFHSPVAAWATFYSVSQMDKVAVYNLIVWMCNYLRFKRFRVSYYLSLAHNVTFYPPENPMSCASFEISPYMKVESN